MSLSNPLRVGLAVFTLGALGIEVFGNPTTGRWIGVEQVELRRDGAVVTEIASIELPYGKSTFLLSDLKAAPKEGAISVFPQSPHVSIENVTLSPQTPEGDSGLNEIRAEIEFHQGRINSLMREKALAEQSLGYFTAFAEGIGRSSGFTNAEMQREALHRLESLIEASTARRSQMVESVLSKEMAIQSHQSAIERLRVHYQERKQVLDGNRTQLKLAVTSTSHQSDEIQFFVKYHTSEAKWDTAYQYQFDRENEFVEASFLALVWHNTGRTWPQGTPIHISGNYQTKGVTIPWSIPVDTQDAIASGQSKRVPVLTTATKFSFVHLVSPSNSLSATLSAEFKIPFAQDFGTGSASVFYGTDWIGEFSNIPTLPTDVAHLPLSPSSDVKIYAEWEKQHFLGWKFQNLYPESIRLRIEPEGREWIVSPSETVSFTPR